MPGFEAVLGAAPHTEAYCILAMLRPCDRLPFRCPLLAITVSINHMNS
jgi:hypothetical protein